MSTKRKTYSADFKAKLVLEVLEGEKTINEIASAYEIIPNNLKNWKKQFLEKTHQVWSTDITYIKLEKGFVYLAAIIDWHSKKILS